MNNLILLLDKIETNSKLLNEKQTIDDLLTLISTLFNTITQEIVIIEKSLQDNTDSTMYKEIVTFFNSDIFDHFIIIQEKIIYQLLIYSSDNKYVETLLRLDDILSIYNLTQIHQKRVKTNKNDTIYKSEYIFVLSILACSFKILEYSYKKQIRFLTKLNKMTWL